MNRKVTTSICPITMSARIDGRPGPGLVCIRGIWAPRTQLNELLHVFPLHDMVIGDIPGMWAASPDPSTIGQFGSAYDELIAQLFPNRPVVVLGVSTGAVTALALKSAQVSGIVAVEPFLSTANVWPLVQNMQHRLISNSSNPRIETSRKYIYEIFGYTERTVEDRDFAPLLDDLKVPTSAVVGSVPLGEPRSLPKWPSLADDRTRALLAAHERVELYEGPPESGHNMIGDAAGLALAAQLLRGHIDVVERLG